MSRSASQNARIRVAHNIEQDAEMPNRVTRALTSDRLWLWLALLISVSVTALDEIPEKVTFGHEVGLLLGGLAYAYLGAWIFNWVIVVRPRAQQLRDIYRVSWEALGIAAWAGYDLIAELAWLAQVDELKDPGEYDVDELCLRIPFGVLVDGVDWVESLNSLMRTRNARLQSVAPFLAHAEHEVLTRLAEVNATDFVVLGPIEDRSNDGKPAMLYSLDAPPRYFAFGDVGNQSRHIVDYYIATERLRACLESLKYAPGPVGSGLRTWNSVLWEQDKFGERATAAE